MTRVPGILNTGNQATEFNATESGYLHLFEKGEARTTLKGRLLVIDLGEPWSVEMLDLNQPTMRENVIKEMKTLLDLPAFDELFINTRSHVQLSAYQGDGDEGIKTRVHYRQAHKGYTHLGIDRAYAPISVAEDPILRRWALDPENVERITTWQQGEWEGYGQDEESPFRWRYARNKGVADGVSFSRCANPCRNPHGGQTSRGGKGDHRNHDPPRWNPLRPGLQRGLDHHQPYSRHR